MQGFGGRRSGLKIRRAGPGESQHDGRSNMHVNRWCFHEERGSGWGKRTSGRFENTQVHDCAGMRMSERQHVTTILGEKACGRFFMLKERIREKCTVAAPWRPLSNQSVGEERRSPSTAIVTELDRTMCDDGVGSPNEWQVIPLLILSTTGSQGSLTWWDERTWCRSIWSFF